MYLHKRKLYFSAYAIILVVILLLGIIGVSTYRNWNRGRQRAVDYIHGIGLTVIQALEAGARSGMMMHMWDTDSVDSLIREMTANIDVLYIYLYNEQGEVTHHSDNTQLNRKVHWLPLLEDKQHIATRIRKIPEHPVVYEMAKYYTPLSVAGHMAPRQMHGPEMTGHSHADDILVLGLNMARYEAYQQEDLQHALVMGANLIVLGTAVIFFIFVIQNYYLVNRSLQASQDFNRLVVHSMADGLMSIDRVGRILTYNQQALTLLGLTEKEVEERNLGTILDIERTGIQQALTRRKSIINQEIRHLREPEDAVTIGLTISPLNADQEQSMGAVLVLRDLTHVKRLAEKVRQAEKLAAVGTLAAGVAHEIRNPLSSIRGFAQFIRHRLKDRPQEQEYAAVMVREIDRINKVVSDLLSLARPAAPVREPSQVAELLHHTLKLVGGEAHTQQVTVELKVENHLPKAVLDENQITQALLNLLINALQATPAGGRIVLGARSDGNAEHIILWVEDDGPGIAEKDFERIFEPFFTTRQAGTGLGLAIVNSIAASHGGQIRVQSPPPGQSRGCRVALWLPIDDNGELP